MLDQRKKFMTVFIDLKLIKARHFAVVEKHVLKFCPFVEGWRNLAVQQSLVFVGFFIFFNDALPVFSW